MDKDLPLVKVHWNDPAAHGDPWMLRSEISGSDVTDAACITVGYIVRETEELVILASSLTSEHFGNVMAIPRVCITRADTLSVKKRV